MLLARFKSEVYAAINTRVQASGQTEKDVILGLYHGLDVKKMTILKKDRWHKACEELGLNFTKTEIGEIYHALR